MAQLRRALGSEHHLFIMLGPSKGVRQINEAGINWLKQHNYSLPAPGGWVPLDVGDYRRLDRQGWLYTKGEDSTKSPIQFFNIPLVSPGTVYYGSPLLLQLADNFYNAQKVVPWKLLLKLDEWEKDAREALIREQAAAVGCYSVSETGKHIFSSISLRQISRADYWPDVVPHEEDYRLYWQNNQLYQNESLSATPLKEATPTKGLKAGWLGNVFFKFIDSGLQSAWKRYLPGMSISANSVNELYWLARRGEEPEPAWPGKAQRVGAPNRGWQLWHLQRRQETSLEDIADWLWYRQIRLHYSAWRLHLLNPLSNVSEPGHISTGTSDRQLLLRCDPPVQQQGNAFLSLTPYAKSTTFRHQPSGSSLRSSNLVSYTENYLRVPAPSAHEEYRISLSGEASGLPLWVQTTQHPAKQPAWLHGLRCSLNIAGKTRTLKAFSDKPIAKPYSYQLSAGPDFSLEQLAQATWSYQPSGIPCSLHCKHLSPRQGLCREPVAPLPTDNALTNWWQNYIWPKVAESSWVKLTLDAASFGSIKIHLILKPVAAPQQETEASSNSARQVWWTNPSYTAPFFWLSRMVGQETMPEQWIYLPELSQALEQLCVPDMPVALKNALELLATNHGLPAWIFVRLQTLLADLHSTFELVRKEGR